LEGSAILINLRNTKTLQINLYLPVDKYINNLSYGLTDDLDDTLTIKDIIYDDNNCDTLVIAGDINCDFSGNTKHSTNIENIMFDKDIYTLWDNFDVNFTCTARRQNIDIFFKIDHFLVSDSANVVHDIENLSDHCPIYYTILIPSVQVDNVSPPPSPKPSWNKASKEEKDPYGYLLDE